MAKAIIIDGVAHELVPGQPFTGSDGTVYPANNQHLLSDEELAAIGALDIVEPGATPSGERVASTSLQVVSGVPTRVAAYEAIPAPTKDELEAYAVSVRYTAMTSGILFDGNPIPTDSDGRGLINGAYDAALADASTTKNWQISNTPIAFVTFSNAQLRALGLDANAMVQACFDVLKTVGEGIAADTITTYAQIDTAFGAIQRVYITPA